MKRYFRILTIFLCLSVLIGTLAACNTAPLPGAETTSGETEALTSEQETRLGELPLEPNKEKLPSYDDLCKVQRGMTREEVYTIAGNPQRTEFIIMSTWPGASLAVETYCYIYDSNDGLSIAVKWGHIGSIDTPQVVLDVLQGIQK